MTPQPRGVEVAQSLFMPLRCRNNRRGLRMPDMNDLIRRRNRVIERGNEILDTAQAENRDLTDEEQTNFDRAVDDAQKLKRQIDGLYKLGEQVPVEEPRAGKDDEEQEERQEKPNIEEQRMAAFRAYLKHPEDRTAEEHRALAVLPDTSGGYTMAPEKFISDLIQAVDNDVFMHDIATVHRLSQAHSLGAPSLSADPADPTWTTELLIGSEDSTMAFSKREMVPHPLAQYIKVSRTLLRRSALPIEELVRQRLAYKASVVLENAYLNGNGASQPLGIFTASAQGVNTGQDVSTGNTTTSIQTDGLLEAQHKLDAKYRGDAVWVFHDDAIKQIRKLKDGDGQYIWRRGLDAGVPDMLLGNRIYESAYAPSTFTSGKYVGAYFVPRFYWIVDTLNYEIQRLDELYAATNQVGFVSRSEHDGAPVLEEAFVRVTLA